MNPNRFTAGSKLFASELTWNELHRRTSLLLMVMFLVTGTRAYKPLSLRGPSISSPSVLPSLENEWQFAQVGRFSITVWLCGSAMFLICHLISGIADCGSGCIGPFSPGGGSS